MNNLQEIIKSRRIIKPESFLNTEIDKEKIEMIMESAIWAPTHGKTEPWSYWVYSGIGKTELGELHSKVYKENATEESFNEDVYQKIKTRPLLASHIVVLAMKRGENPKIPKVEELMSCGCAAQNILLQAHSLGLGAYWSTGGYMFSDRMKVAYGLGADDEFLGCIYLGNIEKTEIVGKRNNTWQEKTIFVN